MRRLYLRRRTPRPMRKKRRPDLTPTCNTQIREVPRIAKRFPAVAHVPICAIHPANASMRLLLLKTHALCALGSWALPPSAGNQRQVCTFLCDQYRAQKPFAFISPVLIDFGHDHRSWDGMSGVIGAALPFWQING